MLTDAYSYLVGLDLFSLYKKDPEKALFYLRNIPSLSGNNIEKELHNNGISFLDDGFENVKKLTKKLN